VYVAAPVPAGCPLHPRQWNTLRLSAQGLSNGEIALQMGVTLSTVRMAGSR
jgi:DNA-binding NarL/FixJ family response regulator